MKKVVIHDAEQLALDLEDATLRLSRLAAAIAARDEADQVVARLKRELTSARYRAKVAGWNVTSAITLSQRARPAPGEGGVSDGD